MAHTSIKLAGVRRLPLGQHELDAHVMQPPHLARIKSDAGPRVHMHPAPHVPHPRHHHRLRLDVTGFTTSVSGALSATSVGFVMQLRHHGSIISELKAGDAHIPADGTRHWTFDTPMHVASLSKMFTAMAIVRLLARHRLSIDTLISPYLPTYWVQGPNVGLITYRHLLTHTSGLTSGATDFMAMKSAIAAGVSGVGGPSHYANMNFSLCRILFAVLSGHVSAGATFATSSAGIDATWDLVTIRALVHDIEHHIFKPAGVHAHLVHHQGDALAYGFPLASGETGFDDGDCTTTAGAAGWHMSINHVLDVMGTFRRAGARRIMSARRAKALLADGLGIDWTVTVGGGEEYFAKNGLWEWNGQIEQGVAFYLPDQMELVVLVNSPVGSADLFLYSVIANAYTSNLV